MYYIKYLRVRVYNSAGVPFLSVLYLIEQLVQCRTLIMHTAARWEFWARWVDIAYNWRQEGTLHPLIRHRKLNNSVGKLK